ncbi:MAG: HEAT repeat domain-containing protein [Verrucomicrobia bacterium]|nr:HEAT repeat domain-containing protein [Verrucomicrobiota bacterium]
MNLVFQSYSRSLAGKAGRRLSSSRWFGLSFLASLVFSANVWSASPELQVLIFSGQNNHDWQQTTPKLKSILMASGRFAVEVTDHPEQCDAKTLARYDVILSDWNTFGNPPVTNWPASTREAFLDFVRSGKGFVAVHAGGSSFYDWPDYQQIAGGYWDLGKTSHGSPHEFTVRPSPDHPITRGVALFATTDELWLRPGVHSSATVIATGEDQPVALCTSFGKGRGFTILMGHSADFADTPGFQTLLLRGTEWAAQGQVSLPADVGERLAEAGILKAVSTYRFGGSRKAVLRLEKLVAGISNDPAAKSALAAKLAAMLSSNATVEARQIACWQLSLIGSANEVPVLARLITDKDLGYYARQTLERIPDTEAETALLEALQAANSEVRLDIINSLVARRSTKAVPVIGKLLEESDVTAVKVAAGALGRIGGEVAGAALTTAQASAPNSLKPVISEALLRCAEGMVAAGNTGSANPILEQLTAAGQPPFIRMAALSARVDALGEKGADVLLAALSSTDEVMQAAAIRALRATPHPALAQQAAQQLEQLTPGLQVQLITLLGDRAEAAAAPALTKATASANPAVKQAAIIAIGQAGDASAIPVLANLGAAGSSDEKRLAVEALARLRGNDVDSKMTAALTEGPATQQPELIRALVLRRVSSAVPALITLARVKESAHRNEAISAAGKLGTVEDCAVLARLLETEPEATASAMAEICRRSSMVDPMLAALSGSAPAGQASLLEALASIGGPQALEAVRKAVKSDNSNTRLAAVRSLGRWPDAAPLDDLAALSSASDDPKGKALALRGLARLAPMAKDRSPGKVVEILLQAMKAGGSLNDQKALLAALGEIPGDASLKAVQTFVDDPALGTEAKAALAQIKARIANAPVQPWNDATLEFFLSPDNLCRGCTATNLDGLAPDGQGQGPYAAVDGDPSTYWDETDNQQLYWIRVQLKQRSTVACLRILGFHHHNFAPKDFEVIGDGKLLKAVKNAEYENNLLTLDLPPTQVTSVELKITGYYSQSPAIRELGLYAKPSTTK